MGGEGIGGHPDSVVMHDLPRFEVRSTRPIDLQLDGDHYGTVDTVSFSWEPQVLPVLA